MGGSKKKEAKGENVHVVVRIRPLSVDESNAGSEEVMRIGADKTSIQVLLPDDEDYAGSTRQTVKKFALDGCLPTSTTQEECFDQSGVKTLLDSVRDFDWRCIGAAVQRCGRRAAAIHRAATVTASSAAARQAVAAALD